MKMICSKGQINSNAIPKISYNKVLRNNREEKSRSGNGTQFLEEIKNRKSGLIKANVLMNEEKTFNSRV